MTAARSPRRVPLLAVAGFLLLLAAALWGRAAWVGWRLADLGQSPERELDVAFDATTGSRAEFLFTPGAGTPHLLLLEFERGLPEGGEGPCPIDVEWHAGTQGSTEDSSGGPVRWRTGEPGMGIVWLGRLDAVGDGEQVVTTHVRRGLEGARARLRVVRDDRTLEAMARRAGLHARLAWIPFGLGCALLAAGWFLRNFRIRRR